MLPINIDYSKLSKNQKENEKFEKQQKALKTKSSQQYLANQLVVGTIPQNPNGQQIQQMPAGN